MAYVNLIDITCADKNEFFCRMRDFLCKRNGTYDYSVTGIGWTLHDSSYATDEDNCAIGDYYVIYSPGENGDEDMYFKISWVSGFINVTGCPSWDSATHTYGGTRYNTINNITLSETGTSILWIYGDLDSVSIINDLISVDCYGTNFGKLEPGFEDQGTDIATCASTLAAGSDVSITVDAIPSNWAVGKELYIRTTHNNDTTTVKYEKIEIKTLVSLTITADLVNSYTAGSKLSDFLGYFCNNSTRLINTMITMLDAAGNASSASQAPVYLALPTGSHDPGGYEDRFTLLPLVCDNTFGLTGIRPNSKRCPTFVAGFAIGDILEEDDGTQWRCFRAYSYNFTAIREV